MKQIRKKLGVVDLFCGCGGFSLGAARAGFPILAGVDNDTLALNVHKKNFPESRHVEADLSKLSPSELISKLGDDSDNVSGIIGGPPCQGFSSIGKKKVSDPRNDLFRRFFLLVDALEPDFFVCENVPGILAKSFDEIRVSALDLVRDRYRLIENLKLSASDFGAPTTRQRVFFIGVREDMGVELCHSAFEPSGEIERVTVGKALTGLRKKVNPQWQREEQGWRWIHSRPNGEFGRRLFDMIPEGVGDVTAIRRLREENRVSGCLGTLHSAEVLSRWQNLSQGAKDSVSRSQRLNVRDHCPTLRAGTGSDKGSFQAVRPIHPTENRVITPREAARLQGFPDWFQFHATKWHSFRQIGNSVSPILAEALMLVIYRFLARKGSADAFEN